MASRRIQDSSRPFRNRALLRPCSARDRDGGAAGGIPGPSGPVEELTP
ncbi:MAG: hypothetical protein LBG06_05895 [Deltaproteobacteria bacterium]|nr:hypothetical protein [Deltaproteobacteria bacterium]